MGTLKKWQFFSKLGSQPPLKSAYPGSCPPKKLFLGRFFLENHFFDPFRPNEDPQVLYMAGKLWISFLWWYEEKNIFLHPVERMIFYDGPHRYFPLYWETVISVCFSTFAMSSFFCTYLTFGGIGCYLQRCTYLGWANVKMLSVPRKLVLRNWEDFVCTTVLLFLFFTPQKSDITDGEILKEELN